jgi:hypothetical protein
VLFRSLEVANEHRVNWRRTWSPARGVSGHNEAACNRVTDTSTDGGCYVARLLIGGIGNAGIRNSATVMLCRNSFPGCWLCRRINWRSGLASFARGRQRRLRARRSGFDDIPLLPRCYNNRLSGQYSMEQSLIWNGSVAGPVMEPWLH